MEEKKRNPTEQEVRSWLIKDITDRLTAAANFAMQGRYRAAVSKKDTADALIIFGSVHGFLEEADRRAFYGTRAEKGKDDAIPGIFPEELEAKARKMIDWDQIQSEVDRRMGNLIERLPERCTREQVLKIYRKMPKGDK